MAVILSYFEKSISLYLSISSIPISIDLYRNYLSMMHMKSVLDLSRMKEIAISNKSALKEVIFWDHCSLN